MGPCSGSAPWHLPVQTPMGELVDSRALRALGLMTHAEGEEHQHGPAIRLELEHEYHPEPTIGRRTQIFMQSGRMVWSRPCSATRRSCVIGTPCRS
jgi:hypothetical protein